VGLSFYQPARGATARQIHEAASSESWQLADYTDPSR